MHPKDAFGNAVMYPKDADGKANIVDLNQTASYLQ